MTRMTLVLALSLLGGTAVAGAAMAQTPPAVRQPAAGPATPAAPNPGQQAAPQTPPPPPGQANVAGGQPPVPTPNGPPEGMIVETPNGFYLVRPGAAAPQRLDIQPQGPQMGQNAQPQPQAGDEAMGDMDDEEMQPPPPPHPHRPPPPHPMDGGKGARFRIHTPNMNVGVKCPDDEPMKACVDAIAQLVDKLNAPAH